ncbi:MAG: hypothetical protein E7614_07120 [Ruminococcaceae bacterium]|nr:hypothetical protein [Oscillospiraceae bacterium]
MKNKTFRFFIPVFILVFALILSSCSNPVSYSVDKEHEEKIKVIYNMVTGLVKNDEELYLSTFEPDYIENVKKVVDTLGAQYFDAESFDDLMTSFFFQNKEGLSVNYGDDVKVKLSFNSVEEASKDSLGAFIDDYSVSYKLPLDKIEEVAKVSVKLYIKGSVYEGSIDSNFILLKLSDNGWRLHPESFLYAF